MSFLILPGTVPSGEVIFEGPTEYTPALTSTGTTPNLGSAGEAVGVWFRMGLLVWGIARFRISGTGADSGTGSLRVSVPVPPDLSFIGASLTLEASQKVGGGRARNNTSGNSRVIAAQFATDGGLILAQDGNNSSLTGTDGTGWNRIAVWFEYVVEPGT